MSNDRNVIERNAYGFPCLGLSDNSVDRAAHHIDRDATSQASFYSFWSQARWAMPWPPRPRAPTPLERAQAIAAEVCARRFPVRKLAVPLPDA